MAQLIDHEPERPRQVRVLTFNMFLRPPLIIARDFRDERLECFIKEVLPNYDILFLQEVFGTFSCRKRRLVEAAHSQGFYVVESPAPSFWSSCWIDGGMLIISRFPILSSDFLPFHSGTFPDVFLLKGSVYAKISIAGSILHAFTAHTQAIYIDQYYEKTYKNIRYNQLVKLRDFIASKVRNRTEMVLLGGDLNVNARINSEYNELISLLGSISPVTDAIFTKYKSHPATFGVSDENGHAKEKILTPLSEQCLNEALDYLLVWNSNDPQFAVDWKDTEVDDFRVKDQIFTQLSDHSAVRMKFTIA